MLASSIQYSDSVTHTHIHMHFLIHILFHYGLLQNIEHSSLCWQWVQVCVLSCFSCIFMSQWTVSHQASLSMEFSRQQYWSGLPCSPSGDLPDPEIKPMSLMSPALAGNFFTTSTTWEVHRVGNCCLSILYIVVHMH